ncbi:MAG: SpoIIE family protein phosphatase [Chloroflexi bacterium]|nr:SpoIIE family protein phosphatase [Chloroflexota bacterium]
MKIIYAHILIIDDDRQRRSALAEHLQHFSYAVSTASSEEQPLALIATRSFDLILLDVAIAGADDFAILRRLNQDSKLNQLPIMVLASVNQMTLTAQCLEYGATDYLLTPANPTLLQNRVNKCLEQAKFDEQLKVAWESFNEIERLADDLRLTILPLGIALSAEKDFDRLLERIVIEAKKICNADAGTLYLRGADDTLSFAIFRTDSLNLSLGGSTGRPVPYPPLPLFDETGQPNHHNVATHVVLSGESENLADIYQATNFDFSGTKAMDARNNYRSISCLTVPLKNQMNGVIGVLQLLNAKDDKTHRVVSFNMYHQLVVESLASQAAVVLHNQLLNERQKSLQEFQHQLNIGRQIQQDFFPSELPQPPGWELEARFHPARQVAGDFYDSFLTPNGKVGLVIADVCDKGLAAALFMSLVRSLIRAFSQQHYHLRQLVDRDKERGEGERPSFPMDTFALLDTVMLTNAYIGTNHRQTHMFATLFFGFLDPETGQLAYVNAGHNPPVIFNADGIETTLHPTGPAVGLKRDAKFAVAQTYLAPGDTLLAYTDGVTEARNPLQQPFTTERLLSLLIPHGRSAAALLEQIDKRVHEHMAGAEPFDDIALLAARRAHVS